MKRNYAPFLQIFCNRKSEDCRWRTGDRARESDLSVGVVVRYPTLTPLRTQAGERQQSGAFKKTNISIDSAAYSNAF